MLLINCEVNFTLTWSSTCVITCSAGPGRFEITDTKLYVPVVSILTRDNAKLLQQLESFLKEQLTGRNINQTEKRMHQTVI